MLVANNKKNQFKKSIFVALRMMSSIQVFQKIV